MPSTGAYSIDMAEVRKLADSMPGDKPSAVRVETVAHLNFPKTAVVAGDSWEATDMPVSAYQVVYADRTVMVDTAFGPANIKGFGSSLQSFDKDAWTRLSAALHTASLIVVTHEHMDHTAPGDATYTLAVKNVFGLIDLNTSRALPGVAPSKST